MKIGILGAGLTGLAAAQRLARAGEVVVFEKNAVAGGCLSSETYGTYTLETLYHHCFSGDTGLFSLLEELGLKEDLIWLKGSTGYYMNGKLHPLIVWLHGAGEGGKDPDLVVLGNKVSALGGEKIQSYFDGAFVLCPQAPTFWMQNGDRPL